MPLFQEKIITKALNGVKLSIPELHLVILQSWKQKIETGSLTNSQKLRSTPLLLRILWPECWVTRLLEQKAVGPFPGSTLLRVGLLIWRLVILAMTKQVIPCLLLLSCKGPKQKTSIPSCPVAQNSGSAGLGLCQ